MPSDDAEQKRADLIEWLQAEQDTYARTPKDWWGPKLRSHMKKLYELRRDTLELLYAQRSRVPPEMACPECGSMCLWEEREPGLETLSCSKCGHVQEERAV